MMLLSGGTDVLVCLYTVPLYSELERPWSPRAPQFKNEKNDLTTQVALSCRWYHTQSVHELLRTLDQVTMHVS